MLGLALAPAAADDVLTLLLVLAPLWVMLRGMHAAACMCACTGQLQGWAATLQRLGRRASCSLPCMSLLQNLVLGSERCWAPCRVKDTN